MKVSLFVSLLLASLSMASSVQKRQSKGKAKGASGGASGGSSGACAPLHVIAARASTNAAGEGMAAPVSKALKALVPGGTSEAVDYPAALAPYGPSAAKGLAAAKEQLAAYVKRCPESKIVLTGYSQGADVAGSVLCGGGDHKSNQAIGRLPNTTIDLGPAMPPIDPEIGSHVLAAILMGDPRQTKGQPFNKGTAKNTGRFPHTPAQNCKGYLKRIVAYCDNDDEFCDAGNGLAPHLGYTGKYTKEAAAFVKGRLQLPFPLQGDV